MNFEQVLNRHLRKLAFGSDSAQMSEPVFVHDGNTGKAFPEERQITAQTMLAKVIFRQVIAAAWLFVFSTRKTARWKRLERNNLSGKEFCRNREVGYFFELGSLLVYASLTLVLKWHCRYFRGA
ncbi:MAG: hypothetical protein PUF59_02255 [Lachnospiraceae bacterium]|nr:hypothetical protein [Lachnospiraceae bacterium]